MTTTSSAQPCYITLTDELVVANRQAVKQRIVDALEDGARDIVLDLHACGYIDSSGWGVLVSCAKRCAEKGGHLTLARLTEEQLTMMELTRLDTLFRIDHRADGVYATR